MPNALRHAWTIRACQFVTGAIFAFSGLAKIGDLGSFALQVHNFRLMPIALENLTAMTLPWVEIVVALALIFGIRSRAGALLSAGMLVLFTVAVISAVARGLDFECGCFGTADASHVGLRKILENLGMLAVATVASLRTRA
jgi:uncharacterized membrane protein YphA (DoxX/SURF4 family)